MLCTIRWRGLKCGMIELNKLQHFLAVWDHKHFGRAAEALGVSQQAVSASISRLEQQLEVALFRRSNSGVVPTEFAVSLEPHARLSLAEVRAGQAEINALRLGGHKSIRLGVGQSFASRCVPEAVALFRKLQPNYSLVCSVGPTTTLYQSLVRGDLDLVVSAPPNELLPPLEVSRELLMQERDAVLVRAAHPLAQNPNCGLEALRQYTWLAAIATLGGGWQRICQTFTALGIEPPHQVVRTDSVALGDSLLMADDFVAVMSYEAHRDLLLAGQLVEIHAPELVHPRPAYIAWDGRTKLNVGVTTLIRALRKSA
jgi:DNA-binding transcriptional LysR family regulator